MSGVAPDCPVPQEDKLSNGRLSHNPNGWVTWRRTGQCPVRPSTAAFSNNLLVVEGYKQGRIWDPGHPGRSPKQLYICSAKYRFWSKINPNGLNTEACQPMRRAAVGADWWMSGVWSAPDASTVRRSPSPCSVLRPCRLPPCPCVVRARRLPIWPTVVHTR
jgi:hypothetical protein